MSWAELMTVILPQPSARRHCKLMSLPGDIGDKCEDQAEIRQFSFFAVPGTRRPGAALRRAGAPEWLLAGRVGGLGARMLRGPRWVWALLGFFRLSTILSPLTAGSLSLA